MATTTRGFRYPVASDSPDVPRDIGNLAADIDGMFLTGAGTGGRPAAGKVGREWYDSTAGITYLDIGSAWVIKGANDLVRTGDARLSDQRTPLDGSVTWNKLYQDIKPPAGGGVAGAANFAVRRLGTTGEDAAAGNDARLSDARTPLGHRASHAAGGADEFRAFDPNSPYPLAGGRLTNAYVHGPQGQRTRWIKNLSQDGNHRRLQMFHISRDNANWSTGEAVEVITRTISFDTSSYSRCIIEGGWNTPFRVTVLEMAGLYPMVPKILSDAAVTGTITEAHIVLDLPAWVAVTCEVKYNRADVSRPFTSAGQISWDTLTASNEAVQAVVTANEYYRERTNVDRRRGYFASYNGGPGGGTFTMPTSESLVNAGGEITDIEGWYDGGNPIPEYKPKLKGWYRFLVEFYATSAPAANHYVDLYVARNLGSPDTNMPRRGRGRLLGFPSVGIQGEFTADLYSDGFTTFAVFGKASQAGISGWLTFSGYYIGDDIQI